MENGTLISSPEWEDQIAQLVEQYESQWRDLIEKLAPPDPSSFVSSVELASEMSPEKSSQLREQLWNALASVDQDYRRRLLEQAPPNTENAALDKTVIPGAALPRGAGLRNDRSNSLVHSPASADAERGPLEASQTDGEGAGVPTVTFAPGPSGGTEQFLGHESLGPTRMFHSVETDDPRAGTQIRTTAEHALPSIPGYRIDRILGRGGMGVVYQAWQVGLNRPVALKMILDKRQADASVLARFQAEAEAVARLDHENIVKIYEIGMAEGLPFFSLEYVDGGSLENEWDAQPLEPARCVEIVSTLARAMARAHAAGLVHRDLKPANVLVRSDGTLKVTDFGLVKRIEDDSGQTQAGTVMGTPSYMSPEQAWGRTDVGPLADVYALGAILYALLTGRPPFQGPNAVETIMQLRENEPLPPSRLQPKIPADLETICLKAIQRDPARRYGSADELADDLRRFRTGEPIKARPVGVGERAWRWCRRNPMTATALFLAFCLAVGGPTAALAINAEKENALAAQGRAEENELKASRNAIAAREAETEAEDNALLATKQRDIALTALNTIVERVPAGLKNVPRTERFKSALLLTAMNGLNLVADTGESDDRDLVMARAHAKMGEGLMQVGETKAAHAQFVRSHAILTQLAKTDDQTSRSTHLLRLGRSYRNLGQSTQRLQGAQAAEEYYHRSLEARRQALAGAEDPLLVKQEMAEALGKLGEMALAGGRPEEALKWIQESVDYREECLKKKPGDPAARREQAGAVLSLGHTSNDLGHHQQAAEHFRKALALLKPLSDGGSIAGRANWAIGQIHLANTLLFAGEPKQAGQHFRLAVGQLDPLCIESPRDAVLKRKLSQALYGWGVAENQGERSREYFQRSLDIRQRLADDAPADIGFQQALMLPLARLGRVKAAADIADTLARKLSADPANLYLVASCYALCAEAERNAPAIAESRRPRAARQNPPRTVQQFEALALKTLRDAVAKGYKGTHLMRVDPDLAPLRHHEEFQKLVEPQPSISEN